MAKPDYKAAIRIAWEQTYPDEAPLSPAESRKMHAATFLNGNELPALVAAKLCEQAAADIIAKRKEAVR